MPGSAADVRLATEAELEAVTALLVAQLREHRVQTPEAKIASAIQGLLRHPERGRILVAVEGGRPVGVAALSFAWPLEYADRSAWLEELYVQPAARGRGIGTRLLRAALRGAADAGETGNGPGGGGHPPPPAPPHSPACVLPLPRPPLVRPLQP